MQGDRTFKDNLPTRHPTKLFQKLSVVFENLLKNQRLAEFGWLIAGQLISLILGFVSMKILTTMGAREFGKYSLVLTIAALVSAILYGPAEQGFVRFYFDFAKKGMARLYISLFYKFLFGTALGWMFLLLFAAFINIYFKTSETAAGITVMGLYIIAFCSSNVYNSILNVLRKRKTNTILQIVERSLIILLVFIVASITNLTANRSFLAILIALIPIIAVKTFVLSRYIPDDAIQNKGELQIVKSEIIKTIATFSLPFAIWGITGWLQSNSERWVIAKYLTTADVGIFSVMAVLANYLVIIPGGIISQFMQPIIYENISAAEDADKISKGLKALKYLVLMNIFLAIFAILFSSLTGKYLILLLSNKEFAAYWYILPILCLGAGVFNVAQTLITFGVIKNVPKIYLWPKIITGVVALILNIFFISRYGILGIAISISGTSIFYLTFVIFINMRLNQTLISDTV